MVKPNQRVGFDTLPDQLVNKCIERGFRFNLLCVGETGIGKSSLLESLFKSKFEHVLHHHVDESVTLELNSYELEEGGTTLNLTLIQTVGFGDQVSCLHPFSVSTVSPLSLSTTQNIEDSIIHDQLFLNHGQLDRHDSMVNVVQYIDEQHSKYLKEELKVVRDMVSYVDTRVHACLYMLPPTGRSIHQLDLLCLKQLSRKVSDSLPYTDRLFI